MSTEKQDTPKPGTFRPGNTARALPAGDRRVVLVAQRVAPDTLRKLQAAAPQHGGIGRLLDHLAAGL